MQRQPSHSRSIHFTGTARRRPNGACRYLTTFLLLLSLFLLADSRLQAQVRIDEWFLKNPELEQRTTAALERYFALVVSDSLKLRYLQRNAGRLPYRLRAGLTGGDSLTQLLLLSIGQLTLFQPSNLRIALGDDLYLALLLSHRDPLSERTTLFVGDDFAQVDWVSDYTTVLSLERIDVRLNPGLGLYAALGAPESNLPWWHDGTGRVGMITPKWEFGLLFPFGGGSRSVGPIRSRLLAPGFGAAGEAHIGPVVGRVRFTTLGESAFDSPRAIPARYVHTFSAQGVWSDPFRNNWFRIREAGLGYEEFSELDEDSTDGTIVTVGNVHRLAPILDMAVTTGGGNVQVTLGTADLSLRGSLTTRINEHFWLEFRFVGTDLFRKREPFEHPFLLFLTPRLKF